MATNVQTVARRYSKALWQLAENADRAEVWIPVLSALNENVKASSDLQALLSSPSFPIEQKWPVLEALLKTLQSPKEVTNFVHYVLKSGRIVALPEITSAFRDLALEAKGAIEAEVESALPLTDRQSKQLIEKIEKASGRKVSLKVSIRPELLAGLRVHLLGRTFDSTLSANLESMQHVLLQAEA